MVLLSVAAGSARFCLEVRGGNPAAKSVSVRGD